MKMILKYLNEMLFGQWERIYNPPNWVAGALDVKIGGHGDEVGRYIAHVKGTHFIYRVKVTDGWFNKLIFTYYRKER